MHWTNKSDPRKPHPETHSPYSTYYPGPRHHSTNRWHRGNPQPTVGGFSINGLNVLLLMGVVHGWVVGLYLHVCRSNSNKGSIARTFACMFLCTSGGLKAASTADGTSEAKHFSLLPSQTEEIFSYCMHSVELCQITNKALFFSKKFSTVIIDVINGISDRNSDLTFHGIY